MAPSKPKLQSKHSKSPSQQRQPTFKRHSSSSLSSHLAMVELKSRILTSLSKLSDRDTHQIAIEDLEKIITNLPIECVPMLINSLTHDPSSDPSPNSTYRRESLRLLALLASTHPEPVSTHLPRIMTHIVKRVKDPDSDSLVRDACKEAVGSLAMVYLKGQSERVVGLFVKPLLGVMNEQNKVVQAGGAACLSRVVECGGVDGGVAMFQGLCPRICKLVGGQGVLAKGVLLSVFSSLLQVGAISLQSMPAVLQSIRECLDNNDWATRKAAAVTLSVLASHSCQLVADGSASTIVALEACRFDKDFMGGSHDSMVTLENRVRGLERVVEEMAWDLSLSSGRRNSNMMLGFEGSPSRTSNKYNGLHDHSSSKFGRVGDGRMPFAGRFLSSERGRDPSWRSDSEPWDSYGYNTGPRSGLMSSRRGLSTASVDGRSPRTEHEGDQPGGRRAWEKGQGPFRLDEGPFARSVWQASNDEATLEAIRVAGEDNETSPIATRVVVHEMDAEALTDGNMDQDKGPLWASWTCAMNSLHAGDVDLAYGEVLSTGDDMLLAKLMERSGPMVDQLSREIASEVLHAVGQFLVEQSLFDVALIWIQQLTELIVENGAEFLDVPMEVKRFC